MLLKAAHLKLFGIIIVSGIISIILFSIIVEYAIGSGGPSPEQRAKRNAILELEREAIRQP